MGLMARCCRGQEIPQQGATWQAALQAQLKAGATASLTWSPIVHCCAEMCMTAVLPAVRAEASPQGQSLQGGPHQLRRLGVTHLQQATQGCASLPALLQVHRLQLLHFLLSRPPSTGVSACLAASVQAPAPLSAERPREYLGKAQTAAVSACR